MSEEDLKYALALCLTEGIGPVSAKALVAYCGSPQAVFREKKTQLLRIPGIGRERVQRLLASQTLHRAEKELAFLTREKIQAWYIDEENYPERLRHCDDSPLLLFFKGDGHLNHARQVSVIGTRRPDEYGYRCCEQLIEGLGEAGISLISGLAYGIDITAHNSCLQHQIPTFGILAHGLDTLYPALHRHAALRMIEKGGLLTEFLSGTRADRENFPRRNRLIAGLADVTVVIQTGVRGGSMITALLASGYHREVAAFPGRSGDKLSAGCNLLIRKNQAALIESAQDLLELMNWEKEKKPEKTTQTSLFETSAEEQKILDLLQKHDTLSLDELAFRQGEALTPLTMLLLSLECRGLIRALPGKRYGLR